jgi:hypothetical protein
VRGGDPDRGAELVEGIAQRRHRQGDADGEHGARGRQRRAEQPLAPVPLTPRAAAGPLPVSRTLLRRLLPAAQRVHPPDHVGQETARLRHRGMLAGVGRPGFHPGADPLQAVRVRLDLVRGRVEGTAHVIGELVSLRRDAVRA